MVGIEGLWLPILVSAVAVFLVSSVIHMASPWHKGDYPAVPDEDRVMAALRPFSIPRGEYLMPRPTSSRQMRSAEFIEKRNRGPVMIMTVFPSGPPAMARNFILWFVYLLAVGAFAAFVAGSVLPPGVAASEVVRFVGVTAFLAYAGALWPMWIWYQRPLSTTLKATVDGVIYALITAGVFAWLWPR